MNQEKIGKFIASCRKGQNLTQEDLANKLGITSKAVSKLEIPRDGSYYIKDMKHIFPNRVLRDMDTIRRDGTIEKLSLEIQDDVNLYFNK